MQEEAGCFVFFVILIYYMSTLYNQGQMIIFLERCLLTFRKGKCSVCIHLSYKTTEDTTSTPFTVLFFALSEYENAIMISHFKQGVINFLPGSFEQYLPLVTLNYSTNQQRIRKVAVSCRLQQPHYTSVLQYLQFILLSNDFRNKSIAEEVSTTNFQRINYCITDAT